MLVFLLSTDTPFWKILSQSLTRGRALQALYQSELKSRIQETKYFFNVCQILTFMYNLRKFSVNMFTFSIIIRYHFVAAHHLSIKM